GIPDMHRMKLLLLSAVMLIVSAPLYAQEQEPSKVDLFTGYSYANPRTRVANTDLKDMPGGFTVAGTYFFNKYAGFTLDGGGHFGDVTNAGTVQIGPTFRFPTNSGVTPFIHGLIGLHEISIAGFDNDAGIGLTGGGGLDFHTKWPRINIRLIQADVQYAPPNPKRNRLYIVC